MDQQEEQNLEHDGSLSNANADSRLSNPTQQQMPALSRSNAEMQLDEAARSNH